MLLAQLVTFWLIYKIGSVQFQLGIKKCAEYLCKWFRAYMAAVKCNLHNTKFDLAYNGQIQAGLSQQKK